MEKRKISLGFVEQSKLEGNMIYVNFKMAGKVLAAQAVSNENFMSHDRSIGGDLLTERGKTAGTYTGSRDNSWHRDYNEFLDDLVRSNDAVLDYSRLIREGAKVNSELENLFKRVAYLSHPD